MNKASNPPEENNPFVVYQLPDGLWTWKPADYDPAAEPLLRFRKRADATADARIYTGVS